MAGTIILYYRNNRGLLGPIETSDEMYYLLQKLKFHSINVAVIELIGQKGRTESTRRLKNCYRDVARDLNVPFGNLKKFKSDKHLYSDGLHPNPSDIRELASEFRRAIKHTALFYSTRR